MRGMLFVRIVMSVALLCNLNGCGSGTDPQTQAVIDALREADSRIQSADLQFTHRVESKRAAAVASGKGSGTRTERYLRDGESEYYEYATDDGRGMKLSVTGGMIAELLITPDNQSGIREPAEKRISQLHTVPLPTRLPLAVDDIPGALDSDRFVLLPESVDVEGVQTQVLEGTWNIGQSGGSYRLYVDENLGYLPRRIETFGQNGAMVTCRELRDYREVAAGVWIAHVIETASMNADGQGESQVNTLTIDTAVVNEAIAPQRFLIEFPPDVVVN